MCSHQLRAFVKFLIFLAKFNRFHRLCFLLLILTCIEKTASDSHAYINTSKQRRAPLVHVDRTGSRGVYLCKGDGTEEPTVSIFISQSSWWQHYLKVAIVGVSYYVPSSGSASFLICGRRRSFLFLIWLFLLLSILSGVSYTQFPIALDLSLSQHNTW